jgi:rhomboid protease GluP
MKKYKGISITIVISLLIILYWTFIALHSGQSIFETQNSQLLLKYGAVDGRLLNQGEYWRIVVSQFTHVYMYHMLVNVVFILLFGMYIERYFGVFILLFVYFLGGMVGQYASVVFNPTFVSSGASQAVCSLAGFLLVRFFKVWRTSIVTGITVLLFILMQSFLDLHSGGHIKEGHVYGFITGTIISFCTVLFTNKLFMEKRKRIKA